MRTHHGSFTSHWFDLGDIAWPQILGKVLKKILIPNLIYFICMMNKYGLSQRSRFLFFLRISKTGNAALPMRINLPYVGSQFQLILSVKMFLQSASILMPSPKMDNGACVRSWIAIINAEIKEMRPVFIEFPYFQCLIWVQMVIPYSFYGMRHTVYSKWLWKL